MSVQMKYEEILGWKVKDKVTGFIGVVTHVGIDLYGCVQAIVHPAIVHEKNGAQRSEDSRWFDIVRLEKIGKSRVMTPIPAKGDLTIAGAEVNKPIKG